MHQRTTRLFAVIRALSGAALILAVAVPSAAGASTGSPSVRLIAPVTRLAVTRFPGSSIQFDPGVFVASVGGAFDVRAVRPDYDHPFGAIQLIHGASVDTSRPLPSWVADPSGLPRFLWVTVHDAAGHKVSSGPSSFCPSGLDQRVSPSGPPNPTYPRMCGSTGPFVMGTVSGIEDGWATSALGWNGVTFDGPDGTYHVRVAITSKYRALFGISTTAATVDVAVTVTTGSGCTDICPPPPPGPQGVRRATRGSLGVRPLVTSPTPDALPDLVALPAWNIAISQTSGRDYIDFSATVWNAGPAPLLVEGFRRGSQPVMDAWQYLFRNGVVVGRVRAGQLEYDTRPGHEHWHFRQFAVYSLLTADQNRVVISGKEAYCLAPTDAIDMTRPGADWNPYSTGFGSACGGASSIWTRETLPAGWGDTYTQSLPGQSLDITALPNGHYFIAVDANAGGLLHEVTRSNNRALREILLGGGPGARTVVVLPWHGITG